MGEAVQVLKYQFGYFPAKFKLAHGEQIVEVDAVEQCWTEMPNRSGEAKYHFRVRCGSDLYRLSQDAGLGRWSIQPEAKER